MTDEERALRVAALEAQIAEALAGPKRVRGDAGEVESHSIGDLLKALDHLKAQTPPAGPRQGLRIVKLIPGGTA